MTQDLQQSTFQKIENELKKIAENMDKIVNELKKLNEHLEQK